MFTYLFAVVTIVFLAKVISDMQEDDKYIVTLSYSVWEWNGQGPTIKSAEKKARQRLMEWANIRNNPAAKYALTQAMVTVKTINL